MLFSINFWKGPGRISSLDPVCGSVQINLHVGPLYDLIYRQRRHVRVAQFQSFEASGLAQNPGYEDGDDSWESWADHMGR